MVRVKGPVIDTEIGSLTVRLAIVTAASRIVFSFVGAMPVTEKMTLASAARGPVLSPNNVGDQLLPDQRLLALPFQMLPGMTAAGPFIILVSMVTAPLIASALPLERLAPLTMVMLVKARILP